MASKKVRGLKHHYDWKGIVAIVLILISVVVFATIVQQNNTANDSKASVIINCKAYNKKNCYEKGKGHCEISGSGRCVSNRAPDDPIPTGHGQDGNRSCGISIGNYDSIDLKIKKCDAQKNCKWTGSSCVSKK